jgi:hypothetical protein
MIAATSNPTAVPLMVHPTQNSVMTLWIIDTEHEYGFQGVFTGSNARMEFDGDSSDLLQL